MGRGTSGLSGSRSGGVFASNLSGVTADQEKTLFKIAKQTANLKNEQYRIVDEDGNIVLAKKGGKHEVAATVGEKREYLKGAVSIHNHPDGGTFSSEDINEFGYGARAMMVSTPEGVYVLANTKYGKKGQYDGWYDMRSAMDEAGVTKERGFLDLRRQAQSDPKVKRAADEMNKTSSQWAEARKAGKPKEVLDSYVSKYGKQEEKYKKLLNDEMRKVVTAPYHDFYKKNASKYGFSYNFKPKR